MGVIIRNGINYSNESFVEVTQAEYDALSEAEKMNGTVYLVDDTKSIVTKGEVYSSSSAEQISYGDGTVKDALDARAKIKYVIGVPTATDLAWCNAMVLQVTNGTTSITTLMLSRNNNVAQSDYDYNGTRGTMAVTWNISANTFSILNTLSHGGAIVSAILIA